MRVLHILEATEGGTRRHVLDLLPLLQKRGIACSLVYSAARNPGFRTDAQNLQNKNIETCEIAMGQRWARRNDIRAIGTIRAHVKTQHYDVIHCHSSNAGLLGRLANLSGSTPLIYTPHYAAFAAGIPHIQRRGALYLEKLLKNRTAQYIAVSRHEYSLLRRVLKLKPQRASIIYNGIDTDSWQSNERHREHGTRLVIGCFGRLTAQKNQATLIRALPHVVRRIPEVSLRLVGSGEDESTLRDLARRLKVDNCVTFCNSVRDPQAEYFDCDIVAQPSRWEGCSYALLEAMAASSAIIASTTGGNPEVIGEAGVLLPARNASAWSKAIIALAQDKARRDALGHAARARVEEKFRLETMVEQTISVYERVIQSA